MLTIKDARGIVFLTNAYDANGRVSRQTQVDGTTYQFAYTVDGTGKVTQTDVTDPRGVVRRVTFTAAGYTLTDTRAVGVPSACPAWASCEVRRSILSRPACSACWFHPSIREF